MFNRNETNNLENIKEAIESNKKLQLALITACLAWKKLIFVEMYQKQTTVTAIFSNSFNNFPVLDSVFAATTIIEGISSKDSKFISSKKTAASKRKSDE